VQFGPLQGRTGKRSPKPFPTTTLALPCTPAELDLSSCRSQSPQDAYDVEAVVVNNRHDMEAAKMAKAQRYTTNGDSYIESPAGRRPETPCQYAPHDEFLQPTAGNLGRQTSYLSVVIPWSDHKERPTFGFGMQTLPASDFLPGNYLHFFARAIE
jgi:hypothetical protein